MMDNKQTPPADAGRLDRGVRPHVTSMRVTYGQTKKKPKAGDRRTTKTHGVQRLRDWLDRCKE